MSPVLRIACKQKSITSNLYSKYMSLNVFAHISFPFWGPWNLVELGQQTGLISGQAEGMMLSAKDS